MPTIHLNGCNYYYEMTGNGSETVVLAHGLLWSGRMFVKQVEMLKKNYQVLTYDHRGQGRSQVTDAGYDMEQLYEDAALLLEKLNLGKVHFGGLSMGGFVGMRLAARRPDLVKSLILMETSAQAEPNRLKYWLLNTIVKLLNIRTVRKPVMKIMFGQKFLHDANRATERAFWEKELEGNSKTIVRAVEGVIHRKGVEAELANIQCPTLILVGTQDIATAPEKAEFIHAHIAHSVLKYIEGGGHTACIEEPEAYNAAILDFLKSIN